MEGIGNTGYEVLIAGAIAAMLAQMIKAGLNAIQSKPVNFRTLVSTGGMPSSHSSSMTAVAVSVGLIAGFESLIFAVAMSISFVVMYDAAGVRRSAGKMAGILNKMTDDIYHNHPEYVPERLKELLGHTPVEVMVGALLGVGISFWLHALF